MNYIFGTFSSNFKLIFEGFDMISYFEVYDGYIINWVKESVSSMLIQNLIWNRNNLMMESEEL